jgi:ribonuclease HI
LTNVTTGAVPHASYIAIFVSGSCHAQRRAGSFAADLFRVQDGVRVSELSREGGSIDTTNNRLELCGAISAMKKIRLDEADPILIFSANAYLTDGGNTGNDRWTASGWKNCEGESVQNADLWDELFTLCAGRNVTFHLVPKSAGSPDLARTYARAAAQRDKWAQKAVNSMFGSAA